MNIFTERFNLLSQYCCIHCGDGISTYKFNKTDNGYELTENFLCQTFDDNYTLWRGNDIMDLINSLKNNDEYRLEQSQKNVLITKLIGIINPAIRTTKKEKNKTTNKNFQNKNKKK